MRRVTLGVLLATIACGGESGLGSAPPAPPPPPPPPPTPVATSLSVQAGDNQNAATGSAVATPPAAQVRDQSGQPMAGVNVAFAVEAGDGSVTGASGTTGADGVVRVGSWVVGPGANRLKATSGTLNPVFWSATGTGELIVPLGEVGSTGGTVTVTRPGTPLDGLAITVPPSAFSGPIALQAQYGDSTGRPARPGLTFASPVVTLSSNATGYTKKEPLTIQVPARLATGAVPVGILFDRATGAMEVIPAVPVSPSRVAVFTRHLDGTRLVGATAGALQRTATPATGTNPLVQLVIGQVQYTAITGDISTTYDPAVDNWEFQYTPLGADIASGLRTGYALSALSYFRTRRTLGPLAHRYADLPGIPESDARGIKVSVEAAQLYDISGVTAYVTAMASLIAQAGGGLTIDSLQFVAIKAAMYLTGQPQIVLGVDKTSSGPGITYVVYGTQGNTLKVTTGTTDLVQSQTRTITYAGGNFAPQPFGFLDHETGQPLPIALTLNSWLFAGASAGAQYAAIDALWPQVTARTIGAAYWPKLKWETRGDARVNGDTVFNWSANNKFWLVCDVCGMGFPTPAGITLSGPAAGWRAWEERSPGVWALVFSSQKVARGTGLANTGIVPAVRTMGVQSFMAPPPGDFVRYIDFKLAYFKTVKLDITSVPASAQPLNVYEAEPFTLNATFSDPLPKAPRFEWDLGDGRKLNTSVATLSTDYPPPAANGNQTSFTVTCSLYDGNTLWAKATFAVLVKEAPPAWRVDSARVTVAGPPSQDQSGFSTFVAGLMNGLTTAPQSFYVVVNLFPQPSGAVERTVVLQRVPPGGVLQFTGPNANALPLGISASPGRSLVMGPLGNGTLVGQWSFAEPGDPDCPSCYLDTLATITATMTPGRLAGTLTASAIGPVYTVKFWATQVPP